MIFENYFKMYIYVFKGKNILDMTKLLKLDNAIFYQFYIQYIYVFQYRLSSTKVKPTNTLIKELIACKMFDDPINLYYKSHKNMCLNKCNVLMICYTLKAVKNVFPFYKHDL